MIHSLRARLLLAVTLTFLAILVLLGLVLDAAVRRTVMASFDASLLSKAKALSLTVEQHEDHMQFEFDPHDMPEFSAGKHPSFFEVWVNGRAFAKSESLDGGTLQAPQGEISIERPACVSMRLPDGRHGRVAVMSFVPRVDEDVSPGNPKVTATIEVAETTGDLEETLERVRWMISGLCAGAVILSGVSLAWVVGRSMRPLRQVADRIAALGATELSERIPGDRVPSEVQPIVDRLNELLGRLEGAFERERAFASDAAHELRTPIAALRTTLEVCLTRHRDPAEYAAAMERCLRVTASMQTVIENLLLLARVEAGELPGSPQVVDLAGVVAEVWSGFADRADVAQFSVTWSAPPSCKVKVDTDNLRLILVNLFDNVLTHGVAGGEVRVQITEAADVAEFRLANSGCTLSSEDAAHVFQRFWRKEPSRSQTGIHAGLGLSLCQRLAALGGGTIAADVDGGCFIVTLRLPRW